MKVINDYPFESFIGSYKIEDNICDELISYYKTNSHLIQKGIFGDNHTDDTHKDSFEVNIKHNDLHFPINLYRDELQKCLLQYIKTYKAAEDCKKFNICEDYHIQYYKPGGGYKIWHNERGGLNVSHRHLVFMTYLNDVPDGGTEFLYQKIKTEAKKGLTLIWPTDWTHQHKGIINAKKEKYIITGWWGFVE